MVVNKIPAGTRIYLTKKRSHILYIQPDKVLQDDILYVAYDVKINGQLIIPKGTRVIGDWITESYPSVAAQLQITKIYLNGSEHEISADSDVFEAVSYYNNQEINNMNYLYKQGQYRSTSNIIRRIVKIGHYAKTLFDNKRNSLYLEIYTKEIPVTLTKDFIAFQWLEC
jgi:hypothetical protein